MEINLFSKCIKDLIVENDRVDVPYLGTFRAEMMPASYSDRQTTLDPPYRKMSFHKAEVSMEEGRPLLDRVRKELGVSPDQASVELGWCLSRLCSELEGSKSCKLPGLGTLRANARNEFFFVPDDDLDIWPDGLGFEPVSIKVSEKIPGQSGDGAEARAGKDEILDNAHGGELSGQDRIQAKQETQPARTDDVERQDGRKRLGAGWIVLIVLGVLLLLFIAASYLFTEQMSPILDRLLYTKEELELLRGR